MPARLRAVADPVDVFIAAIEEMPEAFLTCRGAQHRWPQTLPPFHVIDSKREKDRHPRGGHDTYAERVLICDRCGMERSDAYAITSMRGRTALHRINSTYTPPPGYSIEGVKGQSTKGLRDLIHGAAFDRDINHTQVRGRGRPRKGA